MFMTQMIYTKQGTKKMIATSVEDGLTKASVKSIEVKKQKLKRQGIKRKQDD